jgi:phosphatidylserine/phosphatidylglycerophosphate/cardiolipin synthase-like enzyme
MSRSLVVLPDDSAQPILDAINQAKESLRIKMFVFADPHIMDAVIKAHKRGVKVRVMLNPTRRSGEEENDDTRKRLANAGIEVISGSPSFDLTHEKSMVVDSKVAWVMSLNWDKKNLSETRDYALVTSHSHEVDEIVECFEADWARKPFEPGKDCHMIWCVGNARERIAQFIDNAQHTLFLQNERYQDAVIIERLVRASRRGVKVHVMARPPHTLKTEKLIEGVGGLRILDDVGVKVHKLRGMKLHAKLLFADGVRAIVGSINLAPGSFDSRRELAIEFRDERCDRPHP